MIEARRHDYTADEIAEFLGTTMAAQRLSRPDSSAVLGDSLAEH